MFNDKLNFLSASLLKKVSTWTLVGLACTLSACSVRDTLPAIITPYTPNVQQGNWVTQGQVDNLRVGMTKEQVKFALGTPTLMDVFNANRWEYPYRMLARRGVTEEFNLTVFFENERLVKWDYDHLPTLQPFQTAPPESSTQQTESINSESATPPTADVLP